MLTRRALAAALAVLPSAKAQPAAPKSSLARRIDSLLAAKEARSAHWGVHAVDLKTRRVLYARNANEKFTPASNTKLFSTALALERLGPAFRLETTLRAAARPNQDGVIAGDLRLVGGGDPTLSGREYPYNPDAAAGLDPAAPILELVRQLAEAGVKSIEGDIIGDDRLYPYEPYPEGWTIDDSTRSYGAPVSALVFGDGSYAITVLPGEKAGEPAQLETLPAGLPYTLHNQAVTGSGGLAELEVYRNQGARQVRIVGSVSVPTQVTVPVEDPAHYAAWVLYDALTRQGISVRGGPRALHRYSADEFFDPAEGVELARRESPPLVELARVVNKVSQNLHAELLLRAVARARAPQATSAAGLKELTAFLAEIGIPPEAYHFEDGSGLSRRTLIAPAAITHLLTYMNGAPHREQWESLLPIGGKDGTLQTRFSGSPQAERLKAKTGTLATVSALSGYASTRHGRTLAFSIIANNYDAPASAIRRVIDRIGLALVAWEGI